MRHFSVMHAPWPAGLFGIPLAFQKVAKHYWFTKHEIVPKIKEQDALKKYGATMAQLPKISRDDPAVEEICAKKGDIIKITRKSLTADKAVFFRVVV